LKSTEAHRDAPKDPGIGGNPQVELGDAATLLVAEARALLGAAERREAVSVERARAFARACLEMTELGRAAMAVLDGGVFAGARVVELAGRVVGGAEQDVNNGIDRICGK
jgi:hypothetical protein